MAFDAHLVALKPAGFRRRRRLPRPVIVNRVRLVVGRIGVDIHPVHAVALEIMVRAGRAVNRDFVEVRPAEAAYLGVGVGEQTPLQQRIVREIEPRHNMPRMERRLFVFRKEVIRVAVQHHFADQLHRHQLFRDKLGGIQQVEVEFKLIFFRDELHAELIFRVVARLDGFPQIAAVEVRVTAGQFLGLIPDKRRFACDRFPVETHERAFPFGIDKAEGMDAEAFHGAVAARDAAIGHRPHHVMQRLRLQRHVIPEGVVGALTLRHGPVRLRLHGVDEVREFMGVLNEKDRRVVAHQVENPFFGIELGGEAADIAYRIRRARAALDG
ncbi:hypothetical protein BN133_579 [Cronobacter dublinensis 582]|nr:hypothetical protein BN133_579 [Cronobacter dublinensis 582]